MPERCRALNVVRAGLGTIFAAVRTFRFFLERGRHTEDKDAEDK